MTEKPDEQQLVDLIAAAFDRLPAPAPSRLKAVEDRLVAGLPQRRGTRRTLRFYWWLAAMLVASGAAAWWVGEHFYGEVPAPSVTEQAPGAQDERGAMPEQPARKRNDDSSNANSRTTKPPAIYKKEQY